MNSDRLLHHYERIADAPDAIARLRRFVLDLAVRGKLVPQDANDEPITSRNLRKELDRKQPSGRTGADLGQVTYEEVPVELPASWAWSRLFQICVHDAPIVYGILQPGPNIRPQGVPYIRPSEIENGQIILADIRHTTNEIAAQYSRASVKSGDLILTIVGTIGAVAVVPDELNGGNITQSSCRLRADPKLIERTFLLQALRSNCVGAQINRMKLGTAVPRLNIAHVRAIAVPLPPLAEQHRIVAKVDELMGLCDRLEEERVGREGVRDRLAAASLARLNAPDPETFQADARFALDALPTLTTRPDQIKRLRQTILNLAVRGKLVPQDANDEPAKKLLIRAREAKAALRKARHIGRDEDPEFSESLGEFSSPQHWSWGYLADFALVLGGKRLPAGASFSMDPTDHIYIRVTDMKGGTISAESIKYLSTEVHRQIEKYTIDKEDIYVTIAGTIGEVGVVPPFFDGHNLTENAAKIVFREIDKAFLIMVLRSEDVQTQFSEKTKQMAQPKLALKRILGARVPLPPLAEQHRIVAKVDALMALCDRLEASLTTAAATRRRLLDALLAEALAPGVERELEAAE